MAKPYPLKPKQVFRDLQHRKPGVYADVPAHEYHPDEAFSASKGRNLVVGPAYFWSQTPWNPAYSGDDDSTTAQIEGNAHHTRHLEGPEVFAKRYAVPPRKADYPDAIDGGRALQQACGELGLKKSGTIPELVARLKDSGEFKGELWVDVMARWEADNGGRTKISESLAAQVELVARVFEQHAGIGRLWERGKPEVSIWWVSRDGVPMRTRIDLWAPGEIIEFKTVANSTREPFQVKCTRTIVSEFYHVQAFIERQGVEAALQMPDDMWHGFTPEEIAAYKAGGVPDVRMLMLGKLAPDIYQRILAPEVPLEYSHWPDGRKVEGELPREPSQLWRSAENIFQHMTARFAAGWERHGREPWFEASAPIGLTDREPGLSTWALARETEV
jgi:hypothetical protein